MDKFKDIEILEFYEYLEELRDSGETNMFGSPAYLSKEFNISKIDAQEIVASWMESYQDETE